MQVLRGLVLTSLLLVPLARANEDSSVEGEPERSRHALLVGCTTYPTIEKAFPERAVALEGPAHDVELVSRTLQEVLGLPDERVRKLVGWPDDERFRPTRANIVAALDELSEKVQPEDWVFIYLAGHGTQQRSGGGQRDDELDELDEVFLPADAGARADARGRIPAGLTDDELGRRVRAIRDAGADVWFVADCCHSATLVRGETDVVLRGLPHEIFGVKQTTRPRARGGRGRVDEPSLDRIVAMYGAQSYDSAPEMPLPKGSAEARHHGLFTYLLCQELVRNGPGLTYRELHDRIVCAYQAQPCSITVPAIEGNSLRVIDDGTTRTAPQLLVEIEENGTLSLNLGQLARLEQGTVVELLDSPGVAAGRPERLEVIETELFRSEGRAIGEWGELPPGIYSARVTEYAVAERKLRLFAPEPEGTGAVEMAIFRQWSDDPTSVPSGIELVDDALDADLFVTADLEGLWIGSASGEGGFDLGRVEPMRLERRLRGLVQARNLCRLVGASTNQGLGEGLKLVVEAKPGGRGPAIELSPGHELHPGDRIRIQLRKDTPEIYDVTVLYLDADGGISVLFPPRGTEPRLGPDHHEVPRAPRWLDIVDSSLGLEHILVLVISREPADRQIDLGWLAQAGSDRGERHGLESYLQELAGGRATRGVVETIAPVRAELFTLRIRWPQLGPPAWRRSAPEEVEESARSTEPSGLPDGVPDPRSAGDRMQSWKASRAAPGSSTLIIGDDDPRAVLFDLTSSSGADRGVSPRTFDAEAAFLFDDRGWYAYYDQHDRGSFDRILVDADRDGEAEQLWSLTEAGWFLRSPVRLPWLSQRYLKFLSGREASVRACLSFAGLTRKSL